MQQFIEFADQVVSSSHLLNTVVEGRFMKMQQMLATVDYLISRCRPLHQIVDALVTRVAPHKTAAACFTNGCRLTHSCKFQGYIMFSYYSDKGCTRFVCNTQCFC